MKKKKRTKPAKPDNRFYAQVWRVVDGAVADAFHNHPGYLRTTEKVVRASVNKRVVGALLGFVEQSTRGRSGKPAAVEPCHAARCDTAACRVDLRQAGGGAPLNVSPPISGGAA